MIGMTMEFAAVIVIGQKIATMLKIVEVKMGLSYYARLVVGISIKDHVVVEEKIVETGTKYNPQNGEPYKTFETERTTNFANRQFNGNWNGYEFKDFLEVNGLTLVGEIKLEDSFIGLNIVEEETRDFCGSRIVEQNKIDGAKKKLRDLLEKIGIQDIPEPNLYFNVYCF